MTRETMTRMKRLVVAAALALALAGTAAAAPRFLAGETAVSDQASIQSAVDHHDFHNHDRQVGCKQVPPIAGGLIGAAVTALQHPNCSSIPYYGGYYGNGPYGGYMGW